MKVKIADITILKRKRELNEEDVLRKAASIEEIGLITPIILREGNILVAGLHRMNACDTLGWKEIDAIMFEDLEGLEAEKVEIDENFQQNPLNKLQEAQQALRRREIWEIEHGEITRANRRASSTQSVDDSFSEMICRLLGKSRTLADIIIKVAQDLDKGVQETIAGLPICENRAELKRLAGLPVGEQRKIAKRLKDGAITKVPVTESPTVDEDAPPEPPEDPKPPRTPKTPSKPRDDPSRERKVEEVIKVINKTIKQQLSILESEDCLIESTKSVILHLNKQIIDQLKSIRT